MPSDLALKTMNRVHRVLLGASGGRIGWHFSGMPVLELTTTGRKSGQPRRTMLTSPYQEDSTIVVVASRGGDDTNPAWFLNLRDEPKVMVKVGPKPAESMIAEIADADQRARIWPIIADKHRNTPGISARPNERSHSCCSGRRAADPTRPPARSRDGRLQLTPEIFDRVSRTTAGDATRLLAAVWALHAAGPGTCATLRGVMSQQVTRRLAGVVPESGTLETKSGGLSACAQRDRQPATKTAPTTGSTCDVRLLLHAGRCCESLRTRRVRASWSSACTPDTCRGIARSDSAPRRSRCTRSKPRPEVRI